MSAEPPATCLINGKLADSVPVDDRGLAYGDGLYETIRISAGRPTLGELHLTRLGLGAECLHLELDLELIRAEIASVAARLGNGVLKLTVTRGSGPRGYRLPSSPAPLRIIQASPLPTGIDQRQHSGIALYTCQTRLARQPALAGIKHLNRLEQVLARAEWQRDSFAEGLMLDTDGYPIEGTMSNLFLRLDGVWLTPDLSFSGVRGVMREYLSTALEQAGETVRESRVTLEQLYESSEVFCCNSVVGVWPVVQYAGHHWAIGAATRRAQTLAERELGLNNL